MPDDNPPKFCPFCGEQHITVNMIPWAAQSLEPQDTENTAELHEHQCRDCALSFWS